MVLVHGIFNLSLCTMICLYVVCKVYTYILKWVAKKMPTKIENPHPKLSIIPHFIHVINFLFVEKTIVDISIFIRFTHKCCAVCSGPLASISWGNKSNLKPAKLIQIQCTYLSATGHDIGRGSHLVGLLVANYRRQGVLVRCRILVNAPHLSSSTDRVLRGMSLSLGVDFFRRIKSWGGDLKGIWREKEF